MLRVRLLISLLILFLLSACGGGAQPNAEPPAVDVPADPANPNPEDFLPEGIPLDQAEVPGEVAPPAAGSGSILVNVTGAVSAPILYVTYNKNTDAGGVYDIRFFIDDSQADSPIVNDIVFTLPNEIVPGTYDLEATTTPMLNFSSLDSPRALVVINLAPRDGLPYALGAGTNAGSLTITDTSNNSLSGSFRLIMGEGAEQITVDGQMNGLAGSILP